MNAPERNPQPDEPAEIPAAVVRRSMVTSIVSSAVGSVFFGLVLGSIFAQYVRVIGLEQAYPILLSIGPMTRLLQIVSSHVMERFACRRLFFFLFNGPMRLLWVPIVWVSVWADAAGDVVLILAGLLFLANFAMSAGEVAWLSWLSDLLPAAARGRYFGYRQTITSLTAAAAGVLAGWYIDSHGESLAAFRTVYAVMVVFGLIDIGIFAFVHHPPYRPDRDRPSLDEAIRRTLANPVLRRVLTALAPWQFSNMFMFPFIMLLMLGHLEMSLTEVSLVLLVAVGFGVVFYSLFGIFMDRYGVRTTLVVCLGVHLTLPPLYLFAQPGFTQPVWLAWVIGVTLHPTIDQMTQRHMVMRHSGPGQQTMTFAVLFLMVGLLHSIAPLTANGLADFVFGHQPTDFAGWRLHPYQVIISFGCLFRTAAFVLALRIPVDDPGARPNPDANGARASKTE